MCKKKKIDRSPSLKARCIGDPVKKLKAEMHRIARAAFLGKLSEEQENQMILDNYKVDNENQDSLNHI